MKSYLKKVLLITVTTIFSFTITFSSNGETHEAYIGIFNTLRLGKGEKDYNTLAKSIEMFDVVGLVEVMNKKGLDKLQIELEKISKDKWASHISPYPVGTETYKEYYAYLYKKDKVKFVKSEGFYLDSKNDFIREPFGATFKIENFDFTFVLLHSIYGKKVTQRQYEASKLVDVYSYFKKITPDGRSVIIGGDFNLPANDSSFSPILNHKDDIIYALDTSIKTTIGTKGFANSYDNFFLSKKYTHNFKGKSGAIDITKGDYIKTRKEISDHIPVFIVVDVEKKK